MQPYSLDITLTNTARSVSTSGTALSAALPFGTDRGRWLFTALTSDAYIYLGSASTDTATTSSGGFHIVIPAGQSVVIRLQPGQFFFNVIASAAGTLVYNKVGN